MTDLDESLLTLAKLGEVARGDLDGAVLDHAGVVEDTDLSSLSFVENTLRADGRTFGKTSLGEEVLTTFETAAAQQAVRSGDASLASSIVGITEQDLEASEFSYTLELIERVRNNDAPLFLVGFGLPNTGKTGHVLHDWHRAWQAQYPDGISISNAEVRTFDHTITSLDELVQFCLDNPDVQKFVFIDEGSTHFDARTNSHEIASQFSPFSKRFAKLSVDFATIGHTIKDVHPELKRQATTFFHKPEKTQVQLFEDYQDDELVDPVFPDPVDGLEKPPAGLYDPDDWSSLVFDLDPDALAMPS